MEGYRASGQNAMTSPVGAGPEAGPYLGSYASLAHTKWPATVGEIVKAASALAWSIFWLKVIEIGRSSHSLMPGSGVTALITGALTENHQR